MPVKIRFDKARCSARITNSFNSGLGLLSSEILNDCNLYCKEDTGILIASSYLHSELDEGKLVWQTPYARRQYWLKTAVTDTNPRASWKWCEVAKNKHMTKWERQAQRLLDMNL